MEIDLWTEKHRPSTLDEIVGQDAVVDRLRRFVEKKAIPHCLFAGPPGTAKTTAAMALARDLFGDSFSRNFMELNASDERGINVVRNQIKAFARSLPAGEAPFKILVLDEADHLTSDAQHALRRTMEAYATSCRMILICNYSSRIIPPIQSRCAVFKFSRLSDKDIANRLEYIAGDEGIKITEDGKQAILYLANGDMRAAINLMQAASSTDDEISPEAVFAISGRANPKRITDMLKYAVEGNFDDAITSLRNLIYHEGISPLDLIGQIHRAILNLEIDNDQKMNILEHTANTEFRIAEGGNGEIQISALLSAFGR